MKKIRVKAVNSIHNTEITLELGLIRILTPHQMRRIEKELCGISGCECLSHVKFYGPDGDEWRSHLDSAYHTGLGKYFTTFMIA